MYIFQSLPIRSSSIRGGDSKIYRQTDPNTDTLYCSNRHCPVTVSVYFSVYLNLTISASSGRGPQNWTLSWYIRLKFQPRCSSGCRITCTGPHDGRRALFIWRKVDPGTLSNLPPESTLKCTSIWKNQSSVATVNYTYIHPLLSFPKGAFQRQLHK